MKQRTLGKTNLNVSVIGVGTWQFGGEWGRNYTTQEVQEILSAAADAGINLIDTAECYGDHTSESLIGQALRAIGQRDKWIIATKFGHRFTGFLKRSDERAADDVAAQLEGSLRALQTDYIDPYQYHSIRDSEFDNDALRTFLEKAVKAGKVRHLGNSIAGGIDGRHQVQRSDWAGVEAVQILYNRLERQHEPLLSLCRKKNLGVLARVPLASGLLSGKYTRGAKFPEGDVRHVRDPQKMEAQLSEVEMLQQEVPPGVPMAQWALAWCLKDPAVTCVIPGCKSVEQVKKNAAAVELVA